MITFIHFYLRTDPEHTTEKSMSSSQQADHLVSLCALARLVLFQLCSLAVLPIERALFLTGRRFVSAFNLDIGDSKP